MEPPKETMVHKPRRCRRGLEAQKASKAQPATTVPTLGVSCKTNRPILSAPSNNQKGSTTESGLQLGTRGNDGKLEVNSDSITYIKKDSEEPPPKKQYKEFVFINLDSSSDEDNISTSLQGSKNKSSRKRKDNTIIGPRLSRLLKDNRTGVDKILHQNAGENSNDSKASLKPDHSNVTRHQDQVRRAPNESQPRVKRSLSINAPSNHKHPELSDRERPNTASHLTAIIADVSRAQDNLLKFAKRLKTLNEIPGREIVGELGRLAETLPLGSESASSKKEPNEEPIEVDMYGSPVSSHVPNSHVEDLENGGHQQSVGEDASAHILSNTDVHQEADQRAYENRKARHEEPHYCPAFPTWGIRFADRAKPQTVVEMVRNATHSRHMWELRHGIPQSALPTLPSTFDKNAIYVPPDDWINEPHTGRQAFRAENSEGEIVMTWEELKAVLVKPSAPRTMQLPRLDANGQVETWETRRDAPKPPYFCTFLPASLPAKGYQHKKEIERVCDLFDRYNTCRKAWEKVRGITNYVVYKLPKGVDPAARYVPSLEWIHAGGTKDRAREKFLTAKEYSKLVTNEELVRAREEEESSRLSGSRKRKAE